MVKLIAVKMFIQPLKQLHIQIIVPALAIKTNRETLRSLTVIINVLIMVKLIAVKISMQLWTIKATSHQNKYNK